MPDVDDNVATGSLGRTAPPPPATITSVSTTTPAATGHRRTEPRLEAFARPRSSAGSVSGRLTASSCSRNCSASNRALAASSSAATVARFASTAASSLASGRATSRTTWSFSFSVASGACAASWRAATSAEWSGSASSARVGSASTTRVRTSSTERASSRAVSATVCWRRASSPVCGDGSGGAGNSPISRKSSSSGRPPGDGTAARSKTSVGVVAATSTDASDSTGSARASDASGVSAQPSSGITTALALRPRFIVRTGRRCERHREIDAGTPGRGSRPRAGLL